VWLIVSLLLLFLIMVKPPKTMQPEAVDLEKAGRASGRAFQDNSFHNYMARKIDMQRNQFGVQLPPPPLSPSSPPPPPPSPPPKKKTPPPLSITSPSRSVRFTLETNHESSSSSSKKKKRIKKSSSSASITAILERLQQRHGQGNKRLGRKRKRDKLSDAALSSKWFAVEDDGIPFKSDEEEKESSMKMPPKDETGIHHVGDDSPNTAPKSVVAQVPSKKEKVLSAAKEDTDDETDTAFLSSSSSMLSSISSPRKLRQSRPDLFFLGIIVKVNGYTDPCNETLKRMLQKHGGDLETYETQRVTHILAESLSKAKADIYKKRKKPLPVCTPAWIVDSVQAGKLWAHGNYLLDQLRNPEHNRIASFFCGSKQLPEESSKKAHKESWTKEGLSDPFPCQPESSKSTRRIMPQPQTEEATDLDPFATDSEECKPLIDTVAESTSTSLKQATGKTLSLKGMEEEETTPASSVLEQHHSSATSTDRRDQSSTPPGAFKVYNDVGGDGDSVSEDEPVEFPMFGQQSPTSSADPDETSEVLAFPNAKVAVSVEKEVHEDNKDSDQQVGSGMDVTSKLLHEEATAKQIERRGRGGKSDDKFIDGKIRTTGTLLLLFGTLRHDDVGSQDSPFALFDTGTDPNFLDSFFSNSRLSFIGSYKQRTKNTGSPRKAGMDPGSSSAGLKRFVFHVDMDCFFANVVLRNFPEHRMFRSHPGTRSSAFQ
jgi:hypothetical protein